MKSLTPIRILCLIFAILLTSCGGSDDPGPLNNTTEDPSPASGAAATDDPIADGDGDSDSDSTDSDADSTDSDSDSDSDESAGEVVGPMSAADAIDMFGSVDQPWLGPITDLAVCEQLPIDHLSAVLGRRTDFEVSSSCGDGSITIRFDTHNIGDDPLAQGLSDDYEPIADLGLAAGIRQTSTRGVVVITETHRWRITGPGGTTITSENMVELARVIAARFDPSNRLVGSADIGGDELENLKAWVQNYRSAQEPQMQGETYEAAVTGALRLADSPRGNVVVVHDCYIGTRPVGSPTYYPETLIIEVDGPWRVVEAVGFVAANHDDCFDGLQGFPADSALSNLTGPGIAPTDADAQPLEPDPGFDPSSVQQPGISRGELVEIFDDGTYPTEVVDCWAGGLFDSFGADGVEAMGMTSGVFDLSGLTDDEQQRFIDISADCGFFAATVFDSPPTIEQVQCAQDALGDEVLQQIGELVVGLFTGETQDPDALDSEADRAAAICG